jgi:DNA-binding MarR family transcriptional regulator
MRTISPGRPSPIAAQAARLRELLTRISRRRSLRDPIGSGYDCDLTPTQIHTVIWLGNDGALTMGDLARRVAVTEKTITGIVDRLERDGLVLRERDPADRRVIHVRLSTAGKALFAEVDAQITRRLETLLGLVDPADRRQLIKILEKVEARLGPTPTPTHAAHRREDA